MAFTLRSYLKVLLSYQYTNKFSVEKFYNFQTLHEGRQRVSLNTVIKISLFRECF